MKACSHACLSILFREAAAQIARPRRFPHARGGRHLSPADGAATLTAFTAAAIARAREHFPDAAHALDRLRRRAAQSGADGRIEETSGMRRLSTAEDAGWRGDFIEAEAFAYLAVRRVRAAAQPAHHHRRAQADDRRAPLPD